MRKLTPILVVVFLVTLAACSSTVKVTSDYDKNVNFQQYKTFAIQPMDSISSISQLNQNRIVAAVKSQLTKKGLTEDMSNPDLLVNVAAILKDKRSVSSTTDYYGYGGAYRPWGWGGGMGSTGYTTYNVTDYKEGSLIVDIADSKNKSLVWEGIGNKDIEKPAKDPDAAINAAVEKIMASFPPGAAKKK